ncbi:hypothetical protein RP29_20020 [Acidovorax temperans]|uniref:Uncharacterized protein n=1 Tax=Acidovorax temperans TaxID=80878 RepID=A0A0D7K3C2_9BURK|nr:hypothetical protein RP29_20020 [Acidovorax temperans]
MRLIKDVQHAAQLTDCRAACSCQCEFRSTERLLVQDQPGVPDRPDQGIGRDLSDRVDQAFDRKLLLTEVPGQGQHHGLGGPGTGRAVLHRATQPEQFVAFLFGELVFPLCRRLAIQIGACSSFDRLFKGMALAQGARRQIVVVVALCVGIRRFHMPIILGLVPVSTRKRWAVSAGAIFWLDA